MGDFRWTVSFIRPTRRAAGAIYRRSWSCVSRVEYIPRAGEKLLRSGGFGVIVLDLGAADIPMPLQTRLTGLAHRHHSALICLAEKPGAAFSRLPWFRCAPMPKRNGRRITTSLALARPQRQAARPDLAL